MEKVGKGRQMGKVRKLEMTKKFSPISIPPCPRNTTHDITKMAKGEAKRREITDNLC